MVQHTSCLYFSTELGIQFAASDSTHFFTWSRGPSLFRRSRFLHVLLDVRSGLFFPGDKGVSLVFSLRF